MRKLKLDLGELRVESFDTARGGRGGTVRGLETFVGDTNCGTCEPDSWGGTCAVFGCPDTPNCSQSCETAWGCTCMEGCATVDTWNCGYGCTQQESCLVGTCVIEL